MLLIGVVSLLLCIVCWVNYTVPYLESNYQETMGVPNRRVPIMFVVDAFKVIHLSSVNGDKMPIGVQLHIYLLVLSGAFFCFILF